MIFDTFNQGFQVAFDNNFWQWWEHSPNDPFRNSVTSFGSGHATAVDAALTWAPDYKRDDPSIWREYVALSRAGEFEFGLGDNGARRGERPFFFLLSIVGRVWVALSRYSQLVENFALTGPFEASLPSSAPLDHVWGVSQRGGRTHWVGLGMTSGLLVWSRTSSFDES